MLLKKLAMIVGMECIADYCIDESSDDACERSFSLR
jgi:hypothetical protein